MFSSTFLAAALICGQQPTPVPTQCNSFIQAQPICNPALPVTIVPSGCADWGTTTPCPEETPLPVASTLLMCALQGSKLGCCLEKYRTTITGAVDLRYTATNGVNRNHLPPGMGLSFNPDMPLNNWITVERLVNKESSSASFGYRLDLNLYGSAYQISLPRGLADYQLTDRNGLPNRWGFDPVQHYLEWFFPNLLKGFDVQVGRRATRWGVESLNPTLTPLASHSYAFIYSPFTYTGVFTETKVTDNITITNDFTLGPDIYFDDAARFFWLGAIQYDFSDKTNLRVATYLGDNSFSTGQALNYPAIVDAVFTHKFGCGDKWTYNFEFMYGWQNEVPGIGSANWFNYVNYLTYAVTDNLSVTGRIEYFQDTDGNRTGFAGDYTSYTIGQTWKPLDWLIIRPELRYDRQHDNARPFDGKNDFFGATINGIIVW